MRICFVSDQAFPAWGGEGISTENFSLKLAQRGHQVIFLTSRVSNPPQVGEITLYRFPALLLPGQKGSFAFPLFSSLKRVFLKERIDLIHITLPTYLGWQVLRIARLLEIPVVMGFHVQVGNVIPLFPGLFRLLKFFLEGWFGYFYRQADILIAPSNFARDILRTYTYRPIEVVSNGVELPKFDASGLSDQEIKYFYRSYPLRQEKFLLYVGRLSREKNTGYLLDLIQILKQREMKVQLLLVGRGNLKRRLRRRAKTLGIENQVIFAGYLEEKMLLCAYKLADIFILPSFYELQGVVALEAMASGCALLVAKGEENAAQQLVEEGKNGYTFDLKDPGDAAKKIEKILNDPYLLVSLQRRSREIVLRHDLERSVSRLEEIYHQLVK